jgi:hypothetical protein
LASKSVIYLLLILLFSYVNGQSKQSYSDESTEFKKQLLIKVDNRRTHIHNNFSVIYGVTATWKFDQTLRLKAGISSVPFEAGNISRTDPRKIASKLLFFTLGEEYDFLKTGKFKQTLYLQSGIGWHYFKYFELLSQSEKRSKELIVPIEAGIYTSYSVLSWLDIKLGGGWRWVLLNESRDLSNYYIKIGLGFHLNQSPLQSSGN